MLGIGERTLSAKPLAAIGLCHVERICQSDLDRDSSTAFKRRRCKAYTDETQIVPSSCPCRSSISVLIVAKFFPKIDVARFVVCDKALSKFLEAPVLDVLPRLSHQINVEVQIMQRDQAKSENLFCLDQMTDVSPGEFPTGGTHATFLNRPLVQREFGVFQIERTRRPKCGSITCQPGRQPATD